MSYAIPGVFKLVGFKKAQDPSKSSKEPPSPPCLLLLERSMLAGEEFTSLQNIYCTKRTMKSGIPHIVPRVGLLS